MFQMKEAVVALCLALVACGYRAATEPDLVTPAGIRLYFGDEAVIVFDPPIFDIVAELVQRALDTSWNEAELDVELYGERWSGPVAQQNAAGWCYPSSERVAIWTPTECVADSALAHELLHYTDKQLGEPIDYEHKGGEWLLVGPIDDELRARFCD